MSDPDRDFNALCLPLRPALLARARQLCRDRHAAEDLVQDTYVRAITLWERFEPDGRPRERAKAWLNTMLTNAFRDRYRRSVEHAAALEAAGDRVVEETMGQSPAGPDDGLRWHDVPEKMERALLRLQPDYRDVIMRTAAGQVDHEIAAELGLDPRNVRHRLWRARRELQAYLRPARQAA